MSGGRADEKAGLAAARTEHNTEHYGSKVHSCPAAASAVLAMPSETGASNSLEMIAGSFLHTLSHSSNNQLQHITSTQKKKICLSLSIVNCSNKDNYVITILSSNDPTDNTMI